jgi:hypothetical protein
MIEDLYAVRGPGGPWRDDLLGEITRESSFAGLDAGGEAARRRADIN